jgi:hypothetical protein
MAELLPPNNADRLELWEAEPRRRGDFYCTSLDPELAVGQVTLSALASTAREQKWIPYLAQGFLSNEDAWLERSPPRRASPSTQWPPRDRYGSEKDISEESVCSRLRSLAEALDVPIGWRTFAAHVMICTLQKDFIFRLWWEQTPDSLIIEPAKHSSILSGRSFIWWLGEFVTFQRERVASGSFVAGHQRLHRSHFEIQPTREWRDILGWAPDRLNPLVWLSKGVEVARYDRLHGPLGDLSNGPHHREQPIISRWLITDLGFQQFEKLFGELRIREEFETYTFREG